MTMLAPLQGNGATWPARYWTELNALRDHCGEAKELRILSFGCSTGDELITIRTLFPDAAIFGCDADETRLKVARERTSHLATTFPSDSVELRRHGPFDVVMANSVLMDSRRPGGVDPNAWISIVALLIEVLRPGGILQIINSNIAFRRHPAAEGFTPLHHPLVLGSSFASQFALDGGALAEGVTGLGRSAHLHRHFARERSSELAFEDLDDVHFRKGPALTSRPVANTPHLTGTIVADGLCYYRPKMSDERFSAVEVDLAWSATADAVLLTRTARRVWFDAKIVAERCHVSLLQGRQANAFVEATMARPITPSFT